MDEKAVEVFMQTLGEELDRIDQFVRDNLALEEAAEGVFGCLGGAWALAHIAANLQGVKPYVPPVAAA